MAKKDTRTPVFIAALFTIAKTWKQPKCPSTEEWIKKMWYICTMEYYSAIKNNEIMLFAATEASGVPFSLHPLEHVCRFFDDGHFYWCEVTSHCSFDLHFSNNKRC